MLVARLVVLYLAFMGDINCIRVNEESHPPSRISSNLHFLIEPSFKRGISFGIHVLVFENNALLEFLVVAMTSYRSGVMINAESHYDSESLLQ